MNPNENAEKKIILIVGDSFVDENWLMSRVDIYHSYNVGKEHYISKPLNTDSRIISFCGAASLWRMLHGPKDPPDQERLIRSRYELIGLSAWNPGDASLLRCLLCNEADATKGLTPFRLSGLRAPHAAKNSDAPVCPISSRPCGFAPLVFNLVKELDQEAERHTSSNRLIRLYEGFGSDQPCLQYRFDWRLDLEDKYKNYDIIDSIKKKIAGRTVAAIAVVDHGYGVVDARLIGNLCRHFPDARWYVRCKMESAPWMEGLTKSRKALRLIFTDEQLLEYRYGVRVWRHGPAVLGRAALEVLGDLLGMPTFRHGRAIPAQGLPAENAALLFADDTAIAASRTEAGEGDDAFLINISGAPGEKKPIHVGRSTVFFASLVYWDLMVHGLDKSLSVACRWALRNAYRWTEECTKAWLLQIPSDLGGPFAKAIYGGPEPSYQPASAESQSDSDRLYKAAWRRWNESSTDLGIIRLASEEAGNG